MLIDEVRLTEFPRFLLRDTTWSFIPSHFLPISSGDFGLGLCFFLAFIPFWNVIMGIYRFGALVVFVY